MSLVLQLKSHHHIQSYLGFLLCFRSLMVLYFTFRCMVHFEYNFVKGIRSVLRFIFFACGCPIVTALFVEKIIFSPLCCLCSSVKDQLTIFMLVYFWALYSDSLIYLSFIFPPIPHYVD